MKKKTPKKQTKVKSKNTVNKEKENTTKEKKKLGRPVGSGVKYNALIHPEIVKNLAMKHLSELKISKIIGITENTFTKWKRTYKEFNEAFSEGKKETIKEVESALFNKCVGFKQKVTRPIVVSDGYKEGSHIEMVTYEEKHAPDTTAIKYYLGNRDRERWRDHQDLSLDNGDEGKPFILEIIDKKEKE